MLPTIHAHADEIAASGLGVGTSLTLSAMQPIDPNNLWTLLTLLPTLLGPALAVWAGRRSAGKAARKRARADFLSAEAKAAMADGDQTNDREARNKALEAAELHAEADAMDRRSE